ncbi:gas vesicle protein GvpG [Streptomyces sp. NPDC088785]|uniref:gas vesicle protein GvpG n=1 Tax=Streptomyces sp. NPDC088785 TaxID=3365897 RepID=UPI0037F544E2
MGLISGLLLLPLAPVRGVGWVADRLIDAAERELYDPDVLRARLSALNDALDHGDIDLARFEREEEHLLDLLERRPPSLHQPAS